MPEFDYNAVIVALITAISMVFGSKFFVFLLGRTQTGAMLTLNERKLLMEGQAELRKERNEAFDRLESQNVNLIRRLSKLEAEYRDMSIKLEKQRVIIEQQIESIKNKDELVGRLTSRVSELEGALSDAYIRLKRLEP